MSKVSESLLRGAKEALAYARDNKKGTKTHRIAVPKAIDVKEIRKKLEMSRNKFADEFAFSVRTLEKWERGERQPEGPTRAYLQVIANNPNMVRKTLSQISAKKEKTKTLSRASAKQRKSTKTTVKHMKKERA